MTVFMAECFWPGVSARQLVAAAARAHSVATAVRSRDAHTRYVGSILVPADEIAFCLFEATSLEVAGEIGRRAAIPFERMLEIVYLPTPHLPKELR